MTKQRKVAKPKFLFGHFQEFGDFCYPDKGHSLAMPRPAGRAAGEDCSPLLLHVRAIQNFMILACLTGRHRWPGLNQYVPLLESRVTHLSVGDVLGYVINTHLPTLTILRTSLEPT